MQQIQATRFDIEQVGRHVASSKKRYTWQFSLKDKLHTIILDFSIISGKLKITVDRKVVLENELPVNVTFQYPFTLDGFALNLIQQGEIFQLRINNKVFSHLYTQQKTNEEFKKYQTEVKDIKVDFAQLNTGNKKLSLNIGAFGGMNKKKKEKDNTESQGWNAFAGSSAFPNYFGDVTAQNNNKKQVKEIKRTQQENSVAKKSNLLDDDETSKASKTESGFDLDLIGSKAETVAGQSLFQFDPQSTIVTGGNNELGKMQDLFQSLNVTPPPVNNEVDFFAEQPKNVSPTKQPATSEQKSNNNDFTNLFAGNNLAFNFGSNPNPTNYTTGYGFNAGNQQNTLNPQSFATTNFNLTKKEPIDLSYNFNANQPSPNFSKKPIVNQSDSLFTLENQVQPQETNIVNPLTDININDFNTMQKLFQTNNFKESDMFNFNQPIPQSQPNTIITQQPQPQINQQLPNNGNSQMSFNTMQQLFATTNYSNININQTKPQPSAPITQKPNPLDMFNNNKPASFTTMSGGSNTSSLDMMNFGTMQFNPSNLQSNQFPIPKKPAASNDLI